MLSLAHIGLAGSFGALLVGWLVVVARGLYLARHLFILSINSTLHISYAWYNLLLFVDQNNINENIYKRKTWLLLISSSAWSRSASVEFYFFPKFFSLSNVQKKGGKNSYSQPQSPLKGQIWKRNPVNCCSQRNFIYLNENGRRANLCVMYSNEAKQVVINLGFIQTSIIIPIWIIISNIYVNTSIAIQQALCKSCTKCTT